MTAGSLVFFSTVTDLVITAALKATWQGEDAKELSKHKHVKRILALAKHIFSRAFCVIQCARIPKPSRTCLKVIRLSKVRFFCELVIGMTSHSLVFGGWWVNSASLQPLCSSIPPFVSGNSCQTCLSVAGSESLEPGWMPVAVNRGMCAKEDFNFVADGPENLEQSQLDAKSQSTVQYNTIQRQQFVIAFKGSLRKSVARERRALHRFPKVYTSPMLLFEDYKQRTEPFRSRTASEEFVAQHVACWNCSVLAGAEIALVLHSKESAFINP